MATRGACRVPALNTGGAKFKWNLRDYETAGKLRNRETLMARPLTLREMERPRRGRSFSLDRPKAKPQNKWMSFLPWRVWAEIPGESLQPLRAALGCGQASDAAANLFDQYIREFSLGELLLRVILLCHERRIPPGKTSAERQARADRWLPPSWTYDDANRRLSWLRPTRFGSPPINVEVSPGSCRLLVGAVSAEVVRSTLDDDGAVAHWQEDGTIWVFGRAWRSASTRAAP